MSTPRRRAATTSPSRPRRYPSRHDADPPVGRDAEDRARAIDGLDDPPCRAWIGASARGGIEHAGDQPGRLAQGPEEKPGWPDAGLASSDLSLTEELHSGGGAWPAAGIRATGLSVNVQDCRKDLHRLVGRTDWPSNLTCSARSRLLPFCRSHAGVGNCIDARRTQAERCRSGLAAGARCPEVGSRPLICPRPDD